MNKNEIRQVIAILHAHAPHHEITPETYELWYWSLEDVPYPAAQYAIRDWVKHHKHFPYPAEIRETVTTALIGLPTPDAAWAMVQDRIKATYPGFPAPTWDAPRAISEAVREIGGMFNLRQSERPDIDERKFKRCYAETRDSAIKTADIGALWDRMQLESGRRSGDVVAIDRKAS